MTNIELKRGYEVLLDNNVRFGIRVINNSDSAILDVEVILDYSESLFVLEGSKVQKLGTIPPAVPRTAKFILKPRGCIHKEEIGAIVIYKDHQWKRHTLEMRPKEVHCVCPFLKEKAITRADFLALLNSGYLEERGINFEAITVNKLLSFLFHTCKNKLYRVDEVPVENGKIIYLAGDALGEEAYYLLTAVVKEYDGITQVLLRAASDKRHGLNGFLNEIVDNLRHLVTSASAREIGIIKKEQVINIIDSVVQRTTFAGGEGAASVNIEGSVVQRTEIKADEGKRRREEEERLRKEKEEQERFRREEEKKERERKALEEAEKRKREGQERLRREEEERLLKKEEEPERLAEQGNSIGMKFTMIPAGEFYMGSEEDDLEKPVHKEKINNPFYLGTYPVTQCEWKAVMGDNPSCFKGDDLPVEYVSWDDVQKFIKKLNEKEGTNKYRLPSEAEWEYACRAGTTTRYSFGDDESKLGDYDWYAENSGSRPPKKGDFIGYDENDLFSYDWNGKTHPVGQKKPNSWGLYDMRGNVAEWVQDRWHDNYNGAPTDGSAWESGNGAFRVIHGGCWYFTAWDCRSAFRLHDDPRVRDDDLGFRLLKEQ